MRTMRKSRIAAVIIAFVMVFAMMPMTSGAAFAAEWDGEFCTIDGITYSTNFVEEGNVALWRCDQNQAGAVTIPKTVTISGKTYTVSMIKNDAFYSCTKVTSVTIPNSITNIEIDTFNNCTSLTSVSFPDSVTEIGNMAFNNCRSLQSVKLPSKLEKLGTGAFQACDLRSITLPETLQEINPWCFRENKNLKSVTVPAFAKFGTDYYCFGYDYDYDKADSVLIKDFTMSGYTGSDAEKYAKANGIPFKSLGSIVDKYKYKLSRTSYSYSGKAYKPTVTITGVDGKALPTSKYSVAYSGNKNVGEGKVTISFSDFSAKKVLKFKIYPQPTTVKSLKSKKKGFAVTWTKRAAQTTGYQIQYCTSKNFKGAKMVTVKSPKTVTKSIAKLKAKKKYFVRVRTYKKVGSINYYSSWTKTKSVKTKA